MLMLEVFKSYWHMVNQHRHCKSMIMIEVYAYFEIAAEIKSGYYKLIRVGFRKTQFYLFLSKCA